MRFFIDVPDDQIEPVIYDYLKDKGLLMFIRNIVRNEIKKRYEKNREKIHKD